MPDDPVELVCRELRDLRKRGGATVGNLLAIEQFPVLSYLLNRLTAGERLRHLDAIVNRIGVDNDMCRYARRALMLPLDGDDQCWVPFASRSTVTRRTAQAMMRVARSIVEEARVEQVEFFDDFLGGIADRTRVALVESGIPEPDSAELTPLILHLAFQHRSAVKILRDIQRKGWDEDYAMDVSLLVGTSEVLLSRILAVVNPPAPG
ncbi:hypothetical protein [Nocardia tengchongensis]|uniref:hypothetical protein n=1 Tax=Nocardia tengchongensis TaxID=2055889 RepID=UPI0036A01884